MKMLADVHYLVILGNVLTAAWVVGTVWFFMWLVMKVFEWRDW